MKPHPKTCPNCFAPMGDGGTCPRCGFDCDAYTVLPHHLIPGTFIKQRYQIGRVLGEGGFGITYAGQDTILNLKVAIKEFFMAGYVTRSHDVSPAVSASPGTCQDLFARNKEKFLSEARVLARFNQEPGIVGVRDFCEENGTAYIVMDFLDGITLKTYLERHGPLAPAQAVSLLMPVMRSLQKVHADGIIHRDISPDNIMVMGDNQTRLLDFGAAREISLTTAKGLSVILKPGYAPEEQYRSNGHQGPWTDVYALAATLYRCITGKVPADSMARLYQDLLPSPARAVGCPDAISMAIMKGMAVHQQDRYQDVGRFLADLEAALRDAGDAGYTVYAGSQDVYTVYADPTLDLPTLDLPTLDLPTPETEEPDDIDFQEYTDPEEEPHRQSGPAQFVTTAAQTGKGGAAPHGKPPRLFLIATAAAAVVLATVFLGGRLAGQTPPASISAGSAAETDTQPVMPSVTVNDASTELPGPIQPLLDAGWVFEDPEDASLSLRPGQDIRVTLLNQYGTFQGTLVNQTLNTLPIASCTLSEVNFQRLLFNDNYLNEIGNTCRLSNGLVLNESTPAEIAAACPGASREDNTFALETENSFQRYTFGDDGLLQSIYLRVDSDVLSEAADTTTFSAERPAEYDDPSFLADYTLPDFTLQSSALNASLPLTVEDLIHLGWEVERQPEYIPADSYAYVYLRYDIRTTLKVAAANYTGNAIAPQYGILQSLSLTTEELGNDGYSLALPDAELLYKGQPWLQPGKTTRPEVTQSALALGLHCALTDSGSLECIPYQEDGRAIILKFSQDDVLTRVNIHGSYAAASRYDYEDGDSSV